MARDPYHRRLLTATIKAEVDRQRMMPKSAIVILIIAILGCEATPMEPPVEPPRTLRYGLYNQPHSGKPTAVAARDLDGDGASDLLVASETEVSVLRNDGSGQFPTSSSARYPGGMLPRDLMIQDWNADGMMDFAFFQHAFPHVFVYLNQGGGLFPMMASGKYAVFNTRSPFGAAEGDLNGDGKADFLVSSLDAEVVLTLLNKGDGTFATDGGTPYPANSAATALAIADVSGDGHADAIVAFYAEDELRIIANRGDGTFPLDGGTVVAVGPGPAALLSIDLNRDGRLDLAVLTEAADKLVVLINQGAGTYPMMNYSYRTGRRPGALAAGDLDGDGQPDLAVASASGEPLTLFLNRGDGTFARAAIEPTLAEGSGAAGIAIADLNRDGRADIVVSMPASNQLVVLTGQP